MEYNSQYQQNQETKTDWHEGVAFHNVTDYTNKSDVRTLTVKPVFIHNYSIKDNHNVKSNLLIKFQINSSSDKVDYKRLALWLDYYRLYEVSLFFEKYIELIKDNKVFSKINNITQVIEPKEIRTHFSDKNKQITISPFMDEIGRKIEVSMSIGSSDGLYNGSTNMTLQEFVVLSSAVHTLLKDFPSISESMYTRALYSQVVQSSNIMSAAIPQMYQKLSSIEKSFNKRTSPSKDINLDNLSPIKVPSVEESDIDSLITTKDLKDLFNKNVEADTIMAQKDIDQIYEDTQMRSRQAGSVEETKTSEFEIDTYSVLQEFMNEFQYNNIGEITDFFYKCNSGNNLSGSLYQELLAPMIIKEYRPIIETGSLTSCMKELCCCMKGSESPEVLKEFLEEFYNITLSIHSDIKHKNNKEYEKTILAFSEFIPRFFTAEKDESPFTCSRILSIFFDFMILAQLFSYLLKNLSEKHKFKSLYLMLNKYIIHWGIIPMVWGNYIKKLTPVQLDKALESVWKFWSSDYESYFSYLYTSDLITNNDQIKTSIKFFVNSFFETSGLQIFKKQIIPSILTATTNIDQIKKSMTKQNITDKSEPFSNIIKYFSLDENLFENNMVDDREHTFEELKMVPVEVEN